MRKKFTVTMALFGTALFSLVVISLNRPKDYLVDGKLLSDWTQQLLSSSYTERDQAVSTLAKAREDAIPHIVELLHTRNPKWQDLAKNMAETFRFQLPPFPQAELCQQRAAFALTTLDATNSIALNALVRALPKATGDAVFEIERAIHGAGKSGEAALRDLIKNGNAQEKKVGAKVLVHFQPLDELTINSLMQLLDHRDLKVRESAIETLGSSKLGSESFAQRLKELSTVDEPFLRKACASALAKNQVASQASREALEKLLLDPDEDVRLQAAIAHWKLFSQTDKVLPILSALLKTEYSWQAAYALAEMGPSAAGAIPDLVETLKSEKVPRIMRTPPSASLALGKIGAPAVEPLVPLLHSKNSQVQIAAVLAIGYMGPSGQSALSFLEPLLKSKNVEVRHAAALTMAEVGGKGVVVIDALSEVLAAEDIYMRSTAAQHLRKLAPAGDWNIAPE